MFKVRDATIKKIMLCYNKIANYLKYKNYVNSTS